MRHLERYLLILGVSLVALLGSAIPSSAADAKASQDAVSAVEAAAAPAGDARTAAADAIADRQAADRGSVAIPSGSTAANSRGQKYGETTNIAKRWWWWQQQNFNDNQDDPDDPKDDLLSDDSEDEEDEGDGGGGGGDDEDSEGDSEDEEDEDDDDDQVIICHCPPGNPNNCHTISVDEDKVDKHLGHGDTLGPCPDDETPSDPDD